MRTKTLELFEYDKKIAHTLAGIDEAGRGPLAGPVVCAACVMGDCFIDGVYDSKELSESKREELYKQIISGALAYGTGIVSSEVIDEINILNATKLAMRRAYRDMKFSPDILLIDGTVGLEVSLEIQAKIGSDEFDYDIPCEIRTVVRGDATSYNIAAASIIAKVTRDRIMLRLSADYPNYFFEKHKGYGTKAHIDALKKYGSTPIHRKTFINNIICGDAIKQYG